MPRFKIETSLFEPVTIEVEGGRTFESVPLSPSLIRSIGEIENERKAGSVDEMTALTRQVGLIFGVDASEVEALDVRVLGQILKHATDAMTTGKAGKIDAEATAEKNAPTPEGEPLPS